MNQKLDVDATKLFESLKYQIHVAINYCHTLEKSDVLWVEVFGDVTIEGRDQIEVKDYGDSLTDSHSNFWNTLNNWLKPDFRHQQYTNLILLTTQAFGAHTALKNWESLDTTQRLEILEDIHAAGEARFVKSACAPDSSIADQSHSVAHESIASAYGPHLEGAEDVQHKSSRPSDSLRLQRKVMAADVRKSLLEALPKIRIVTEQPDLLELIARYKAAYLKPILVHRQDEVIDALFGFMTTAAKVTGGWQITGAEFDKKFAELTAKHMTGTLKFPEIDSDSIQLAAATVDISSRQFAVKLNEIGVKKAAVLQAAVDLLHAEQYILDLCKDCTTSEEDITRYSDKHLRLHQSKREAEIYRCASDSDASELKRASVAFYHNRCGEDVTPFGSYEDTPPEFRNGVYHLLADEEPTNPRKVFHWRLWD